MGEDGSEDDLGSFIDSDEEDDDYDPETMELFANRQLHDYDRDLEDAKTLAAQYKEKPVELTSWEIARKAKKRMREESAPDREKTMTAEELEQEEAIQREIEKRRQLQDAKRRKMDIRREQETERLKLEEKEKKKRLMEERKEQMNMTDLEKLEKEMSKEVREGLKEVAVLDAYGPCLSPRDELGDESFDVAGCRAESHMENYVESFLQVRDGR